MQEGLFTGRAHGLAKGPGISSGFWWPGVEPGFSLVQLLLLLFQNQSHNRTYFLGLGIKETRQVNSKFLLLISGQEKSAGLVSVSPVPTQGLEWVISQEMWQVCERNPLWDRNVRMGTSENMWVRGSPREGRSEADDDEQMGFLREEGDGRDRDLPHSSDEDQWQSDRGWLVSPVRALYPEVQVDGWEWAWNITIYCPGEADGYEMPCTVLSYVWWKKSFTYLCLKTKKENHQSITGKCELLLFLFLFCKWLFTFNLIISDYLLCMYLNNIKFEKVVYL